MSALAGASIVWLVCLMRVPARGNLTVALIHQQRFDVAYVQQHLATMHDAKTCQLDHTDDPLAGSPCRTDRVELSHQACAYDPWHTPCRVSHAYPPPLHDAYSEMLWSDRTPHPITPVVGSAVLAGLGVALVVPGSLLDVVA